MNFIAEIKKQSGDIATIQPFLIDVTGRLYNELTAKVLDNRIFAGGEIVFISDAVNDKAGRKARDINTHILENLFVVGIYNSNGLQKYKTDLAINGDLELDGNLEVKKNVKISGDLKVEGNAEISGNLIVAGKNINTHMHSPGSYTADGKPVVGISGTMI